MHEIRVCSGGGSGDMGGDDFAGDLQPGHRNIFADFCDDNDCDFVFDWVREKEMRNARRYAKLIWRLIRIRFAKVARKDCEYRRAIFENFREWGGVYIKFLQILGGSSKFLDGWGGPREMEIFAQAPREKIDIAEYINIADFAWVSEEAVAAGSFALVYRGRLKTGEDVAIKILRPSIQKNLKTDLRSLRKLCWLFSKFLPQYLVDYTDAYDAYAKMLIQETDYRREMENQKYFAEFYREHPRIVIPRVYESLSSDSVIVQDFIEGPALADIMSMATRDKTAAEIVKEMTGSDVWEQVVLAGGEALYTAMCADYVYGDPHPGNIILLSDNRIGFIDFGIIAQRPTSHETYHNWVESYYEILCGKGSVQKLLETTVTCFCPDISLAMQKCNFDDSNLLRILSEAVTQKLDNEMIGNVGYSQSFQDGHLMDVFIQVVGTRVLDVKVDAINFELLKAMQAFLGAVTILDNREGKHRFSEIMCRAMEYALTNARVTGVPRDAVKVTSYGLTESYELLINTFSSLADNDEYLFNLVKERIFA